MAEASGTVNVTVNWHHRFPCNHVFAWHAVVPPTHCPNCGACLHPHYVPVPYPVYPGVPYYPNWQPVSPPTIWSSSTGKPINQVTINNTFAAPPADPGSYSSGEYFNPNDGWDDTKT